jgi:tRNA threonylcarbamoyladenosine biosynthesis protein TsaE
MAHTVALGAAVGQACRAGDLIALVGELGAGKTQLVRGLARGLGLDERMVSSPTFVMVQEYTSDQPTIDPQAPALLVHVDAYRITTLEQLESIGWDPSTLLPGGEMRQQAVVAVEWADRLAELAEAEHLRIELTHRDEQQRDVMLTGRGAWAGRLAALRSSLEAALGLRRPCPICRKPVAAEDEHFPFCSSRCRQVDLGKWFTGQYAITRPIEHSDLEEDQ